MITIPKNRLPAQPNPIINQLKRLRKSATTKEIKAEPITHKQNSDNSIALGLFMSTFFAKTPENPIKPLKIRMLYNIVNTQKQDPAACQDVDP